MFLAYGLGPLGWRSLAKHELFLVFFQERLGALLSRGTCRATSVSPLVVKI